MTHKEAVLKVLSDRKPHTHHELYALGCVAHSRIADLRKDGYVIEHTRKGGVSVYQLIGALGEPAAKRGGDDGFLLPGPSVAGSPSASIPASPSQRAHTGRGGALDTSQVLRSGEMSRGEETLLQSAPIDSGVCTQAPRDFRQRSLFDHPIACVIDESAGLA